MKRIKLSGSGTPTMQWNTMILFIHQTLYTYLVSRRTQTEFRREYPRFHLYVFNVASRRDEYRTCDFIFTHVIGPA